MIVPYAAFTVASAQGEYTVESYASFEFLFDALKKIEDAFIVADERVMQLYPALGVALDKRPVHVMAANESEKTLAGVERGLLALQHAGGSKRTKVVAIGGGITQDVATLVAHLWYRGVDFILLPTTLLAMADSCIGAKTAINLGAFKNQIGTFQSPRRVMVCERFVDTLADEDVLSGYGEIVKLAIVDSADALKRVRADIERDGLRGPHLPAHIRMCLETKRRVIEIDEYERDLRKTLNYGHTFGHALESVLENEVPHGIAVAWGVDVANYVSWRKGLLSADIYADVHDFMRATFGFKVRREYDAASLITAMGRDKKAASGVLNLILPAALGELRICPTPLDDVLAGLIHDYLASADILR